jgi:hypothetical protein
MTVNGLLMQTYRQRLSCISETLCVHGALACA